MNETMRTCAACVAGRFVFGFAFLLPLIAGAAAPTASIGPIVATPQTNFNGSVVTAQYTGSIEGYTVAFKIGDTSYPGTAADGTMTFAVPGTAVTAGNIYAGAITATKDSDTYTIGGKYLYQGAQVAGGGGTNGWFKTWATDMTLNEEGGAWSSLKPPAADSKIVIDEDANGVYNDFVFAPTTAASGQAMVFDMTVSFDAAQDEMADVAGAQASVRVVTVGDTYRFSVLTNGVWATNTTMAAYLGAAYPMRMALDYRQVPATITYEVLTNGVYEQIASGVVGTTKSALENVTFNGTGKLALMTGSNIVDTVDASLVKDGDGTKYANIGAALANNVTNLTLLWNTAWQPPSGAGEFRIAKGDYNWYYTPENGLLVKLVDGTYVVVTDYWEVMNLNGGVSTNYMFLTNVLKLAETDAYAFLTNLYLLRDVALPADVNVYRDTWFNGESNILTRADGVITLTVASGKTFAIESGLIGVPKSAFKGDGTVALTGGRFPEGLTNAWHSFLPSSGSDYVWAQLATPVRSDYPGYQYQPMLSTVAPKANQELLPVTDANGESVSIVLNTSWAAKVTDSEDAETQAAEFSKVQVNGMTRLDNEVLGLAKDGEVTANNIPVITPHQSTSTKNVTFSLGNVSPSTIEASGAKVTYRVVMSSDPGGKDGAASTNVVSTANVQMPLPSSGVQYYIIEVDTGAVK